jgi:hypothetical protein
MRVTFADLLLHPAFANSARPVSLTKSGDKGSSDTTGDE